MLSAKLAALPLPIPQAVPERLLGVGHAKAQSARPLHVHAFHRLPSMGVFR
jgi:hypothetical protein